MPSKAIPRLAKPLGDTGTELEKQPVATDTNVSRKPDGTGELDDQLRAILGNHDWRYTEKPYQLQTLIQQSAVRAQIELLEQVCCCDSRPISKKGSINVCDEDHLARLKELREQL
jgi:hypothetical protein